MVKSPTMNPSELVLVIASLTLLVSIANFAWNLFSQRSSLRLSWIEVPRFWTVDFIFGFVTGRRQKLPAEKPYGIAALWLRVTNDSPRRSNSIDAISARIGSAPFCWLGAEAAAEYLCNLGAESFGRGRFWSERPDISLCSSDMYDAAIVLRLETQGTAGKALPVRVTVTDSSGRKFSIRAAIIRSASTTGPAECPSAST